MKIFKKSKLILNEKASEAKISEIKKYINSCDAVVIGAGAGLSSASGLTYSGERFEKNFSDFIERYGMKDMYSAGFYPFSTQEEKWAYWSRHIFYNRYDVNATRAYTELFELIKNSNYFVITTNVDHQFWISGFDDSRIFAAQGDYGLFQCAKACHKKLYKNETAIRAMVKLQRDCKIPEYLVPKCPVCGGNMEVNLRCDDSFVEDDNWDKAAKKYSDFINENMNKKILFLELGVGMNTPVIIKYPFWRMTYSCKNSHYVCINNGEAWAPKEISNKSICLNMDIMEALEKLKGEGKHES
ncbi:MAG: Sir2 silent information regulator family NAD-dependent deacetylase [Candidatus Metalachnospira sp.]|nr:Sir2 silent information regulator family NAD-dependent deacetylase [Candidatus Metalachnospira sp.]